MDVYCSVIGIVLSKSKKPRNKSYSEKLGTFNLKICCATSVSDSRGHYFPILRFDVQNSILQCWQVGQRCCGEKWLFREKMRQQKDRAVWYREKYLKFSPGSFIKFSTCWKWGRGRDGTGWERRCDRGWEGSPRECSSFIATLASNASWLLHTFVTCTVSNAINYCRPPSAQNLLSLRGHVPGYLCNNFAGSQDITCHCK